MAILTGPEIARLVKRTKEAREDGLTPPLPIIDITPFDEANCGPNSYDVRLANKLLVYDQKYTLDMKTPTATVEITIPESGLVLRPGTVYLASTVERTVTAGLVPYLDGRSSVGRLGISIHATAGRGDDGFGTDVDGGCAWTLEISVIHPVWVYADVRIGQLTFHTIKGERDPYRGKYGKDTTAVASRMHEDTH